MKDIIFSRFSNERAEEFNIRTDIVVDNNGKKIVYKSACSKKGLSHLDNIYEYYLELSKMYSDTNIQINKCVKRENKLEFEYIEGVTLEERLDQLLYKKDNIEFFKLINNYISYIKEGLIISEFVITEEFNRVFGDVDVPVNISAGSFNNIDILFGNIIINDKWNIIDYEWSFNFPIPLNYIIYRSLFYYFKYSNRNELLNNDVYQMFDISKKEIKLYEIMENNFQKYILGSTVPIRNLSNSNLKIKEIFNGQNRGSNVQNLSIQIFFDYGIGMSEENSYVISIPQFCEKIISFNIENLNKAIAIRIDPANEECLVSNLKIIDLSNNIELEYITNGVPLQEDSILFNTNDPQIVLNKIDDSTKNLEIEFHIDFISNCISNTLLNFYNRTQDYIDSKVEELELKNIYIRNLNLEKENILHEIDKFNSNNENIKCKIEDLEFENLRLKNQIEEVQKNYDDIKYSNCWKITKPIRIISNKFKK